ncbi:MAG TPA: TolC family protein [Anaerolineae bacterium]|nr:TolC family protein [Anaerolineae bacterium]
MLTNRVEGQIISTTTSDTLRYSVEEAVLIALERNPTVTIQRINHAITGTFKRQQRAAFDPVFSTGLNQTKSKTQRFLGATRVPYLLETKRFQYDIGLSENLPTGTELFFNTAMSGYSSNIYTNQYTGSLSLSVTQSLLKGFGLKTNLANLRKANLDLDISRSEMKGIAEQVVASVKKAYWELYLAAEEITIQERSMELAEQQLKESEERVAVGKLPELELATVHAEVATRRQDLILAHSHYEQARLRFLFLLNPTSQRSWQTEVVTVEHPAIPSDTLSKVDDHVKLGMIYRPDLIQAKYQLEKNEIDVVQTRNGLLPRLDVFVTLGRTSYAETFNEGRPDIGSNFYDIMTGFTFNIPVLDRSERASYARAKHSVLQREEAIRNMGRMIQRDVRSAYIDVKGARQLIDASRVNRELQEKKLEAELEKFRVGKSTNFLVLQAQRDYTMSLLTDARALVDYNNTLTDLFLMEGTLLERNHIETGTEIEY